MKGIILAGGSGTRLYPLTKSVSKQLLPIGDKPMIYYPLSSLMQAKIKEVLIITTPRDIDAYKELLGDGKHLGMRIEYAEQDSPKGIADAFIVGREFIGNKPVCLILGDNIFHANNFAKLLKKRKKKFKGANIFCYEVSNPSEFGIVKFNDHEVIKIEEKPKNPDSNYAVVGLYFYDNKVVNYATSLKPSKRGEIEITDINNIYLKNNELSVSVLDDGFAWLDTGTHKALTDAGIFVTTIEERQGIKIGCIEKIAFENKWISLSALTRLSKPYTNSEYGKFLKNYIKKRS